ncbi:hypothetical protein Kpho02_61730 [Kitasatospora phosalacinea]|uniref:VTT domain-containing protein n=1 Tax=Kitasatospora phosalacinea TaxID=2065 RepID=A0A9W6QB96_9ACTN|nr:DedA family protein [Kitasatospora phosalacinea]GLW73875.1 hypothetical protein Kpho02_61730 [Kitasatospora phosalacinea]
MTGPAEVLGLLPAGGAYALVAAVVLGESVLVVGAFVPTFTVLLTAGALARAGCLDLPLLTATAAGAAALADFLAHRTGRALGPRLRTCRPARRLPAAAWERVEKLLSRHGGRAVFAARFLPVARTLAPHLVGAAGTPYRRIAPFGLGAALLWATAETGAGYLALATWRPGAAPVTGAVIVVVAAVAVRARRRRRTVRGRSGGTRGGGDGGAVRRVANGVPESSLEGGRNRVVRAWSGTGGAQAGQSRSCARGAGGGPARAVGERRPVPGGRAPRVAPDVLAAVAAPRSCGGATDSEIHEDRQQRAGRRPQITGTASLLPVHHAAEQAPRVLRPGAAVGLP